MSSTTGSTSIPCRTCSAPSPKSGGSDSCRPGSRGGSVTESIPITTSLSAPRSSAGLIGVFSRVPPSKYQPRASRGFSTRTGGNRIGIAADARTCSSFELRRHVVDRRASWCSLSLPRSPSTNTTVRPVEPPVATARDGVDHALRRRCVERPSSRSSRELLLERRRVEQARQPDTRQREDLARVAQQGERHLAREDRSHDPVPCDARASARSLPATAFSRREVAGWRRGRRR